MQNDLARDIILRSSDGALFYTWKIILSVSSPILSDMFALSQQNEAESSDDGRPIIDLSEDGHTIEHLLSLCHPPSYSGKKFQTKTLQELCAVLEAATKYEMWNLRAIALGELSNSVFLRQDPVRVYALACLYGEREMAQIGARHTLALPTLLLGRDRAPELEKIHAGLLGDLVLYREQCAEAARTLADDHTWIVHTSDTAPLFECKDKNDVDWTTITISPPSKKHPKGRRQQVSVHRWWMDYMQKSARALQRSPGGDAVKDPQLVKDILEDISDTECKECKESLADVKEAFKSFVKTFAEKVEDQVAKVNINIEL